MTGLSRPFRAAIPNPMGFGRELVEIAKIVDAGKLAPVIDRILPLSEARRAHELSQSGHTHGKIVLRVKNGDRTKGAPYRDPFRHQSG